MIIIQARMTSTRLPGKIMLPIAGKPILQHVVKRARQADDVMIVCTTRKEDDVIREQFDGPISRGIEHDVLGRFYDACDGYNGDALVRVTSDCPMVDPKIVTACYNMFYTGGYDYVSTSHPERTVPSGFDVEVFLHDALVHVHFATLGLSEPARSFCREHVTPYMYSQSGMRCGTYRPEPAVDVNAYPKLSVDTQEDYERVKRIAEAAIERHGEDYTMYQALELARELA